MIDINVKNLNLTGWLVVLASLVIGVLVAIPIGKWALHGIDRTVFRSWTHVICMALAIPGFGVSVGSFWLIERTLCGCGVSLHRRDSIRTEDIESTDPRPASGVMPETAPGEDCRSE